LPRESMTEKLPWWCILKEDIYFAIIILRDGVGDCSVINM
jgi:hypothetical protein